MRDHPTTLAAAKATRYGCWAGHSNGNAYDPKDCAMSIMPNERGPVEHQCGKPNGHGPAGLYCSQHAAEIEGTTHLRGTKLVYWFGVPSSVWAKDNTPHLYAFHVRKHGEREVRVMTPSHYRVLGLNSTTCLASKFADTPAAALAAYAARCADRFSRAMTELDAARAALDTCPTEPGEPTTLNE